MLFVMTYDSIKEVINCAYVAFKNQLTHLNLNEKPA